MLLKINELQSQKFGHVKLLKPFGFILATIAAGLDKNEILQQGQIQESVSFEYCQ